MSVFNGKDFLRAAVDSVLAQTFQDFEFVIIDDGSKDSSTQIIRGYTDSRIILVSQENRGLAAALNRGLEIARGEYIARQDADDISLPDRFAAQVRFLDAHPEIAVLGTGALLIDSEGRPFSKFSPFMRHRRLVAELHRGVCPLMHGSVMVRRGAIVAVGGYKPVFSHAQDVELWLRMSGRYRLANIRESFYHYRKHNQSITQSAYIDLKIRAFGKAGKFSTNTNPKEWVRFVEEFDRNVKGSRWERVLKAEQLLRDSQVAMAGRRPWPAALCLCSALRLHPGLTIEIPDRVCRRLWRTLLPNIC